MQFKKSRNNEPCTGTLLRLVVHFIVSTLDFVFYLSVILTFCVKTKSDDRYPFYFITLQFFAKHFRYFLFNTLWFSFKRKNSHFYSKNSIKKGEHFLCVLLEKYYRIILFCSFVFFSSLFSSFLCWFFFSTFFYLFFGFFSCFFSFLFFQCIFCICYHFIFQFR